MTFLGKILVVVNLVFSVLVGGFVAAVFATRTNWRTEYDKALQELTVSRANRDTYRDQVTKEKEAKADVEKKLAQAVQDRENDRAAHQVEMAKIGKKLQEAERNTKDANVNYAAAAAEAKRRQQEIAVFQKSLSQRDETIKRLQDLSKTVRDEKVHFQLAYQSQLDRNEQMLVQVELLTKENQKLKTGVSGVAGRIPENPPPDDVEGLVKQLDAQSGYVTISLGTDAGINVGHTLEVFRLKPDAKYVGQIRIVAANHHEAVGKPTTALRRGAIVVGDRVANKINLGR